MKIHPGKNRQCRVQRLALLRSRSRPEPLFSRASRENSDPVGALFPTSATHGHGCLDPMPKSRVDGIGCW
jgi:hypothetical protein